MSLAAPGLRWRSIIAVWLALSALACGCGRNIAAGEPRNLWHADLKTALAVAQATQRPLLVVSVLGDLSKRC